MTRAVWKGFLKVGEVLCPVALHAAASTSGRVAFRTVNRATGNAVERQFKDTETGEPVEKDDQVKGYEVGPDTFVILEPEQIASALPANDKTLEVSTFVPCTGIDDVYFDRPYFVVPSSPAAAEAFALIRDGMLARKVAAVAQAVLFRRVRTILIRPQGGGLIGTTLNFAYEVRSSDEAFADIPGITIEGEMLDLARHIIEQKRGTFDPATFDDRYDAALADLIKAKKDGRRIERPKPVKTSDPGDLLAALRESAGAGKSSAKPRTRKAAPARKAG